MEIENDLIAVSIEEAGRMLGFKRSAAYKKFTTGEIPGLVNVGGCKRVSLETLRAWVKHNATETISALPDDQGRTLKLLRHPSSS